MLLKISVGKKHLSCYVNDVWAGVENTGIFYLIDLTISFSTFFYSDYFLSLQAFFF